MIDHDQVKSIDRVPVKGIRNFINADDERIRTDFFCALCNSIFVILLFIISIAVYNNSNILHNSG